MEGTHGPTALYFIRGLGVPRTHRGQLNWKAGRRRVAGPDDRAPDDRAPADTQPGESTRTSSVALLAQVHPAVPPAMRPFTLSMHAAEVTEKAMLQVKCPKCYSTVFAQVTLAMDRYALGAPRGLLTKHCSGTIIRWAGGLQTAQCKSKVHFQRGQTLRK